jgi:hypothetical protein
MIGGQRRGPAMVTMTFEDVVQRINKRLADIGPQIHLTAQYVRYILYNTNSVVLHQQRRAAPTASCCPCEPWSRPPRSYRKQ